MCLYVHVAGEVGALVKRLARGVAPGGTLLLVGHRPVDPATGQTTAAAGQVQVSVEDARAALDPAAWHFRVAEERPRAKTGTGVDAVIAAVRVAGCGPSKPNLAPRRTGARRRPRGNVVGS